MPDALDLAFALAEEPVAPPPGFADALFGDLVVQLAEPPRPRAEGELGGTVLLHPWPQPAQRPPTPHRRWWLAVGTATAAAALLVLALLPGGDQVLAPEPPATQPSADETAVVVPPEPDRRAGPAATQLAAAPVSSADPPGVDGSAVRARPSGVAEPRVPGVVSAPGFRARAHSWEDAAGDSAPATDILDSAIEQRTAGEYVVRLRAAADLSESAAYFVHAESDACTLSWGLYTGDSGVAYGSVRCPEGDIALPSVRTSRSGAVAEGTFLVDDLPAAARRLLSAIATVCVHGGTFSLSGGCESQQRIDDSPSPEFTFDLDGEP